METLKGQALLDAVAGSLTKGGHGRSMAGLDSFAVSAPG